MGFGFLQVSWVGSCSSSHKFSGGMNFGSFSLNAFIDLCAHTIKHSAFSRITTLMSFTFAFDREREKKSPRIRVFVAVSF